MKLENEKAFIKAITDIMFNNNLRFKVGFREGIINYIHPTSTHYMVTELVYKSLPLSQCTLINVIMMCSHLSRHS